MKVALNTLNQTNICQTYTNLNYYCFQHRFIKDYTDKSDILNLVLESKAEVEEVVQDLTEEEDIQEMKVNFVDLGLILKHG